MSDFFSAVLLTLKNFFKFITDTVKEFFKYIDDIINAVIDWFTNVSDSTIDFIKDLPILIIKTVFNVIGFLLDMFPAVCDYCFADFAPRFKFNMGLILSANGSMEGALCYFLRVIDFQKALQTISCGVAMWAFFRLISLIRG